MEDLVGGGPSEGMGGAPGSTNAMNDLLGVFGDPGPSTSADGDLINGFGGLSMDGGAQQGAAGQKQTNAAILDLFGQ
jgi:hypothetical protein